LDAFFIEGLCAINRRVTGVKIEFTHITHPRTIRQTYNGTTGRKLPNVKLVNNVLFISNKKNCCAYAKKSDK
jgi:hypothetical protein